ncbi:1360_t:CDS:2, partial [Cetraspora pellucida]
MTTKKIEKTWSKLPTKEELEEIKKRQERSEKDLEFREQEELEMAVKRRAIAVHHAKVSKFHPDNENGKPENDNAEKKNSRTDWLRNKQIIVYNRAKIDNYLSNAFEQILYQVEERE